MAMILIILGILCLGYYLFLQIFQVDFAVIWLLAGGVFTCLGLWNRQLLLRGSSTPVIVKWFLIIVVFLGLAIFLFLESLIISCMNQQGKSGLDYVIVLGAQVRGDVPSRSLRKRIKQAEEYLRKNPETIAILSGGQGPGENMTEAECMRRELIKLGIDGERLIKEEKSTSTKENLECSAQLALTKEVNTGLITQNFHVYRSLQLAKKQGYLHIYGIAAPSELIYQPHFMVREAFALVKEKLKGNI